jgi:beta-lactamase superfamily II metal-dependent hydrolase
MSVLILPAGLTAQNLEIHYINVQQGASTLIIGPNGTTILFDGGYEFKGTNEVVPYLQSLGISTSQTLDYIIASHRDTDHYVGLTEVMNYGYDAYTVYDNGSDKTNIYVDNFLAAAATTSAGGCVPITLGEIIDLGSGATATCVAANGYVVGSGLVPNAQANENDRSIALLIKYGDFDYILHGDMGGGSDDYECTGRSTSQVNVETPMAQSIMPGGSYPLLTQYGVELAHVSHHGSESSTNSDYMNLFTPTVACISVGAGQGTGWYHPRQDVVESVLLAQAPCITAPAALVLQTEEGDPTGSITSYAGYCVGDIVIATDGVNSYSINATGAVSQGPDERSAAGLPRTYFFDEASGGDTPPLIYNIHTENVTQTSADIAWNTNENATSLVRYGTSSGNYTMTESDLTYKTSHNLSLANLTEATTYYYVVESTDSTSNTSTSAENSFTTSSPGGSAEVVFSEIFYDTPGTDSVEEWIELYNNTASTVDVGGWTITDNNGTGSSFTIPSNTTIAPNSYLTIAVNSSGFNALYGFDADVVGAIPALNNDGDTLLLKDGSGTLKDQVAWEGGATAGIPTGWGSTTEPAAGTGYSIYRTDSTFDSDTYSDWSTASGNGDPQTQGSTPPPQGGDVVFSEIFYDTPGTDADEEWIELYNKSTSTVNIGGWTITDNNGTYATFTIPAGETIAPGTYYTIAANNTGFNALYGYDADIAGTLPFLNNDGDALVMKDSAGTVIDAVAWEGGASEGVPENWGSSSLPIAATGQSIARSDVNVDTDTYADWATLSNNGDPQTQATSAPLGSVVFSEIFYDTPGTDADEEWIELYNNTPNTVNIGGWTITDNNGTYATFTIPAGEEIAPGTYYTIAANSAGFNALYSYDADLYGTLPFLNNDGDALVMKDSTGTVIDTVAWEGGASAGLPEGWGSASLPSSPTGSSIVRTDVTVDTHTYADWSTAANNGNPQTQGATPGDTTPPVISNVLESTVSNNSATIQWDTDEDSDSVVEYGTSSSNYTMTASDSNLVTSHSITLGSLSPNTTYYYVVKSTDAASNTSTSSEYFFTTDADPQPDYMVNSIALSAQYVARKYQGTATITVTSGGLPVDGATVNITWSNDHSGTDSGTTDANGQVTFLTPKLKLSSGTFTITVNGISNTGYIWDSGNSTTTDTVTF